GCIAPARAGRRPTGRLLRPRCCRGSAKREVKPPVSRGSATRVPDIRSSLSRAGSAPRAGATLSTKAVSHGDHGALAGVLGARTTEALNPGAVASTRVADPRAYLRPPARSGRQSAGAARSFAKKARRRVLDR